MKIVAVVPMKLNNRRLPKKNIKRFTNGEPLCHYILSTLLAVELIEEVYVYCSAPEIQKYIPDQVKYRKRDGKLDSDAASMNEILISFAREVEADIYVMAHTTAPFLSSESIAAGLEMVKSGNHDSSFAARKLQDFLWQNGEPMNYALDKIPRTQDLPVIYEETSGFYIYKREVIMQMNRRIGKTPFIVEVGEIEAIDIDEEEDFVLADAIYNYRRLKIRNKRDTD